MTQREASLLQKRLSSRRSCGFDIIEGLEK